MNNDDEKVLRKMHLHKRNAHKVVIKALKKSKSETALSIQEMEELKGDVEPLIKLLDDCVGRHLWILEDREGDQDDEIEEWEDQA